MPNIITSITTQKKNTNRLNIFINDQYAFSIDQKRLTGLNKGTEISQEIIDRLKKADEYDKAYNRAVNYLKFRPRSSMEIKRYLTKKKIPADIITETINKLETKGYINDSEFAQLWVENRLRFRPKGIFALTCELKDKGVTESIIDLVTKGINEEKYAWKAVAPKLNHWRNLEKADFKKKIYPFLSRRGFHFSICKEICEQAWQENARNGKED